MRRGFLSLIAIVISLLLVLIVFLIAFNRWVASPIFKTESDPRKDAQETVDKVLKQQKQDKVEFEQTDEAIP